MISYPLRAAAIALGLLAASGLSAQTAPAPKITWPAASPGSTLNQRVGVTDVTVVYSRPSAHGRKIFGGLVPYNEVWRTGANAATKVTFSTPVTLNGTAVAAGTYELFTKVGESSWTVILQKDMNQWGAYKYDPKNDIARFDATPVALAAPVETFTICVSDITSDSAQLNLSWERVKVPIKLQVDVVGIVQPQIKAAMEGDGKKPYYQAAQFYYDHDLDIKQALAWMDQAMAAAPNQYYLLYHEATFLAKAGDKQGALAAAHKSMEIAEKEEEPARSEYLGLNKTLIDQLK